MKRYLLDGEFLIGGIIICGIPRPHILFFSIFQQEFAVIGRESEFIWPPKSPDLNPLDLSVWTNVKDLIYQEEVISSLLLVEKLSSR
ncbi:hypothetical protein NQ318_003212 [Aromia moschata]|uniref:Tc1-like transposase DDE domain-containing protein n=1 Tax=Aromia moschata TaxID=1265417 RepID=A0AAV8XJX7_9CUCU|nr:hypothetical protein NQ318_003212 [Aromia moschata]